MPNFPLPKIKSYLFFVGIVLPPFSIEQIGAICKSDGVDFSVTSVGGVEV